jgi:hypothetical protein
MVTCYGRSASVDTNLCPVNSCKSFFNSDWESPMFNLVSMLIPVLQRFHDMFVCESGPRRIPVQGAENGTWNQCLCVIVAGT